MFISRSCLKLGLAGHPDIVIVVPALIPGIPLLHVSFTDSLYGSVQVRHVSSKGKISITYNAVCGAAALYYTAVRLVKM